MPELPEVQTTVTGVKKIQKLTTAKKWDDAKQSLAQAYSAIDKAAKKRCYQEKHCKSKKSSSLTPC